MFLLFKNSSIDERHSFLSVFCSNQLWYERNIFKLRFISSLLISFIVNSLACCTVNSLGCHLMYYFLVGAVSINNTNNIIIHIIRIVIIACYFIVSPAS